jgi:H+/gluconate symporter-like permease
MRKVLNIAAGICGGGLVAIGAFYGLTSALISVNPGCAPNQIDEQCVFRPTADAVVGACAALLVWLVAAFFISRFLIRRQAQKAEKADTPGSVSQM